VLPGPDRLGSAGAPSAHQRIHVGIGLGRRDAGAEEGPYRRLYDPTTTGYHRLLTPGQFGDRFGVAPDRYSALVVTGWGTPRVAALATARAPCQPDEPRGRG
jgi:hypothetical protein